MTGSGDKPRNTDKLLQLALPLMEAKESPATASYYTYGSTRTSTANANLYARMACYSLVQLPSISISYSPGQKHAKLLCTKENNSLFMQANIQTPLGAIILLIVPLEMVCCSFLRGMLGADCLPLALCLGIYVVWQLAWRWQMQRIRANRSQKSLDYLKVPDRINLTTDGLQLVWSSRHGIFVANAVRWSKMRLVHLEKDDSGDGHFICIRMSNGGLLRFHSSGFTSKEDEELLSATLLERAALACKEPPKYLSVQPERTSNFSLRLGWWKYFCRQGLRTMANKSRGNPLLAALLGACMKRLPARKTECHEGHEQTVEAMASEILAAQSGSSLTIGGELQGGRYKILRKLTQSFDSVAYLAEAVDPFNGKRYAYTGSEGGATTFGAQTVIIHQYEMLPASNFIFDCEELYGKLLAHVNLCARLDSKRIARWLDHFVENGRGYVVFEYCSGKTLRQYVQETGSLSEKRALCLALQMADIVAYLHTGTAPVMHGDLSPDAFVIDESGEVKLIATPRFYVPVSKETGGPGGRPAYMAPEYMRGSPCRQSDLYAFGATLYFMLTGENPEILQKSEPKHKVDSISPTMNALVAHSTEQELPKRIENVEMLKRQLIQSEAEHLITRLIS